MASHRIVGREDVFPEGTVLSAYPVESWREGAAPSGTAAATATVEGGVAELHGLNEHRRYVAYALVSGQHRGITFRTQPSYEVVFGDRGRIESLEELMRDRTVVSVEECGAVSGEADSTFAFATASWMVYVAGGGVVTVGDGTYRVQGVPWFEGTLWQGNGPGASILKPVDSESTRPMFEAQATAEVRSSERFTQGGFTGLEIDGEDADGECIGVSTFDLQEVAAVDAASGLYTWLQQLFFLDNYVHDCKVGLDLWGDCRMVQIEGNRFWTNDTGFYVQGNHPNIRLNDIRSNRIGVDCTELLDVEIVGCKFNQNDYGLGGPPDRVDRFGAAMGRVDRTRIVSSMFFENHVLGARITLQNQVVGCFFKSDADDDSSTLLEITGSANRVLGCWFFHVIEGPAVALKNGSDGLQETIHMELEHNYFSISGGGRGIQKTGGTNDIQGFRLHGNNFTISSAPADGFGGAVMWIPGSLGNFEHFSIDGNYFWSSVQQPVHMVLISAAGTKGYVHALNQYVSTQSSGASKGFKVLESLKAVVTGNRFTGGSSGTTGFGTAASDPTFMMDLGTTTGASIRDNPDWATPASPELP